jgi:hypothetical protein
VGTGPVLTLIPPSPLNETVIEALPGDKLLPKPIK